MSDTIPPLYSSSPPPLTKSNFADDGDSEEDEDDDDDEYGKFEEYSAVYDHTFEEILNNSPRNPIKSEPKVSINSSEVILGKDVTDLPNNFHCTTAFNLSSVPVSSDILHSKSPDENIGQDKTLPKNSISLQNQFFDSAINSLGADDILIVNNDKIACDNPTLEYSEPANFLLGEVSVTLGNSINCSESIVIVGESTGRKDVDSCNLNSCNDTNSNVRSKLNELKEEEVSSNVNNFDVSSIPIIKNCSNLTSVVDGTLNDDDFENFMSYSAPVPKNKSFVADVRLGKEADVISKINSFSSTESVGATCAQSEINNKRIENDVPLVASNFCDRITNLSSFKGSETSEIVGTSDLCHASYFLKNTVEENSNDLSKNGFRILTNSTRSGGIITTSESNFSPINSSNSTALESNQITEDIIRAEKKVAQFFKSNFASAPHDLSTTDKINSNAPHEDDGFGDFEYADILQEPTSEPLNLQDNALSKLELLSDDDFCDFGLTSTLTLKKSRDEEKSAFSETESSTKECPAFETDFTTFGSNTDMSEDDDFSDFKSTNIGVQISSNNTNLGTAESSTRSEDIFGDFKASFSKTSADIGTALSSKSDNAEEEFDDFTAFNAYNQSGVSIPHSFDPLAAEESSKFWSELFSPCEEGVREIDVVPISDLVVASRIWTKLHDLDSLPALSFDWSKSTSYNKLLSSLNIDVRNVFGLQWKSNVPRFAANLGCAPLEPSKAAKDSSCPISQPHRLDLVPAAHFDWISSGLVNPLDGTKKKETRAEQGPKQKAKDEAIDTEVQEFLESLPDLSFMLVSRIQFPMNPTTTDKSA